MGTTTGHIGAGKRLEDTRWLSADQVAALFQVPRRTIYAWADSGRLGSHRVGGRLLRFTEQDLDEFLRRSDELAP